MSTFDEPEVDSNGNHYMPSGQQIRDLVRFLQAWDNLGGSVKEQFYAMAAGECMDEQNRNALRMIVKTIDGAIDSPIGGLDPFNDELSADLRRSIDGVSAYLETKS